MMNSTLKESSFFVFGSGSWFTAAPRVIKTLGRVVSGRNVLRAARLIFMLQATICVDGVSLAADPLEELTSAALEKRQALATLRKQAITDPAKWPKGDVPGLDFTKAAGNAIIVHAESGRLKNPLSALTNAVPFKLFHLEDDPYRLAPLSRGIGLGKGEDTAKYRTVTYRPALEHMVRAKYVMFVVGELSEPQIDVVVKSFTAGKFDGVGILYEIESKKPLGGFAIAAKNSAKITTRTGSYTGQELDTVMYDLENNVRTALWKGLKTRFPSAKIPTIVYLDSKE